MKKFNTDLSTLDYLAQLNAIPISKMRSLIGISAVKRPGIQNTKEIEL